MGDDRKMEGLFILVRNAGGDGISQVDLAIGKVEVRCVTVIREDIAL